MTRARRRWPLVVLGIVAAVAMGVSAGSVLLGVGFAAQTLCLVRWHGGVRLRLAVLSIAVIVVVWFVEATRVNRRGTSRSSRCRSFVALLPALTATSLWWWDIVRELDRARRAEGRLAAAQERLRLAGRPDDCRGTTCRSSRCSSSSPRR